MQEITGDLWQPSTWKPKLDLNEFDRVWLCITTNGAIKKNGAAVMGAGLAKDAKQKFPNIDSILGERIAYGGNCVHRLKRIERTNKGTCIDVYSFPTKHHWRERSDLALVKSSASKLVQIYHEALDRKENNLVVMPRPGCGNGKLDWHSQVKPAIEPILKEPNLVVISWLELKG
jgi:hypothetical protein